jgi:hypothetical protein
MEHRISERDRTILKLRDMFRDLQRMKFGVRSEKIDSKFIIRIYSSMKLNSDCRMNPPYLNPTPMIPK